MKMVELLPLKVYLFTLKWPEVAFIPSGHTTLDHLWTQHYVSTGLNKKREVGRPDITVSQSRR